MSMISNAHITGGAFSQNIDQRHVYAQTVNVTPKSPMDRLQEAVAHTAFHNSGERFDPPRCHPNTRVAVLDKIEKWALRTEPETSDASILWLSGAAGAGKSAIAQTLAERFHSKGLLIASFFFGRSDPTRNHARLLVSTIVYQLYSLLPPPERSRILDIIDRDPLIFTKSLSAQFEVLIVDPLKPLLDNGYRTSVGAPHLIIIDGLDECLDRGMQRNVLLMLSASVHQFHLPFNFLLASRSEHDIQITFRSSNFLPIHTRLFLDDTYLPDHDIELFLRDEFEECRTTHPYRNMIPPGWPSDDIVEELTRKSSGQFIYASVVAKYIQSSRHQPHHRLDVVLDLRPAVRDLPFSELDALYTHIFSRVDSIERVLDIIGFQIIFQNQPYCVEVIEGILRLDAGEVVILLCDLASVIGYLEHPAYGLQLKILHASLADYLLDRARSKEYFIDGTKRCADYVADCVLFLSNVRCQDSTTHVARMAIICFEEHCRFLGLTERLYNTIRGFSILRICDSALNMGPVVNRGNLLWALTFEFLPALFSFLKRSDSAKYLELYQHHQSEYDLFLRENINACSLENPMSLVLAVVTIYRELPIGAFHFDFDLLNKDQAIGALQLNLIDGRTGPGYLEYLSDFLHDRKRSREVCAGPRLFAQAAKYCLIYLCNHTAFAQKAPPQISVQQCMRRKYTPWKWRRRVIKEDIRASHVTPWLWLRRPTGPDGIGGLSQICVLHRKTNDFIYIHSPHLDISMSSEYNDPVVKYRVNFEKYYLVLIYLNCFLRRAAKLDDLVHMCQRWTFASRYQDFPRESARVRSYMQKYATRFG